MKHIAIAGNPNSGKTCLFNQLTGSSQRVGNYPGVTVEFVEGDANFCGERVKIIDLPGTYSLTAYSVEELVARDYLIEQRPDVIIDVIDAANLERHLYFTAQLLELQVPIVLAVNMVDVAEKKGVAIDTALLGSLLGVKAIPLVANRGRGLNELKQACMDTINEKIMPKPVCYTHELQQVLPDLTETVTRFPDLYRGFPPRWIAVKLLEEDTEIHKLLAALPCREEVEKSVKKAKERLNHHSGEDPVLAVAEARYGIAAGIDRQVAMMSEQARQLYTDRIDRIVCNRLLGPMILCAVVYLLFTFVFKCAEDLQWLPLFNGQWVSPTGLFELFFQKLAEITPKFVTAPWLLSLINDGIIGGVGGVMSFVPLIFFMFLFIAILEDTGYIARVAFIMDRLLRAFGLQGKSILALIVSGGLGAGGCAVPGVMATRTLREEKDRLITILVVPFMNCGAKMPVYAMLIAAFFSHSRGAMMFLLWLLSWGFAMFSAVLFRKCLVKGEQTPFVMELPVYHLPTFRGIMMDTCNRTWMYIRKAGTIILAMSVIMWITMYYPHYDGTAIESRQQQLRQEFAAALAKNQAYAPLATDELVLAGKTGELEKEAADAKDKTGALVRFAAQLAAVKEGKPTADAELVKRYQTYAENLTNLDHELSRKRLENSFAGRAGRFLEPLTRLAGFHWRENIALIGGLAAKEVVLGTLGTAYSMGNDAGEDSLAQTLAARPDWNRLKAFALLVFIVGYAPCVATLAAIKKETGRWGWALFSTVYSTVLAFIVAAAIYQIGLLF